MYGHEAVENDEGLQGRGVGHLYYSVRAWARRLCNSAATLYTAREKQSGGGGGVGNGRKKIKNRKTKPRATRKKKETLLATVGLEVGARGEKSPSKKNEAIRSRSSAWVWRQRVRAYVYLHIYICKYTCVFALVSVYKRIARVPHVCAKPRHRGLWRAGTSKRAAAAFSEIDRPRTSADWRTH